MGMQDVVAERRMRRYRCDTCDVSEMRFYDVAGRFSSDPAWDHDWQLIVIGGEEQCYCSKPCLETRLGAVLEWAYPPAKGAPVP